MTAYRIEHDDVTGRFEVWWPVPHLRLIAVGDTIHEASLAMEAHWQQVLDGTDDPTLDLSRPTPKERQDAFWRAHPTVTDQ